MLASCLLSFLSSMPLCWLVQWYLRTMFWYHYLGVSKKLSAANLFLLHLPQNFTYLVIYNTTNMQILQLPQDFKPSCGSYVSILLYQISALWTFAHFFLWPLHVRFCKCAVSNLKQICRIGLLFLCSVLLAQVDIFKCLFEVRKLMGICGEYSECVLFWGHGDLNETRDQSALFSVQGLYTSFA